MPDDHMPAFERIDPTPNHEDQIAVCAHHKVYDSSCGICRACNNTIEAKSDRWLRDWVPIAYTPCMRESLMRLLADIAASADGKGFARGLKEPRKNDVCHCAKCSFVTINPGDSEHCPNCNNELYPVSKLIADGGCFDPDNL